MNARHLMTIIVIGLAASLAILLGSTMTYSIITAGIVLSVLFCAMWIASLFGWGGETHGKMFLVLTIVAVALTVLANQTLVQRTDSYCGDGTCRAAECRSGCEDCKPADCNDGLCIQGFEDCSNSKDCACIEENACDPARKGADMRGCAQVRCGDGLCDEGFEDRFNCCSDCGCLPDYECENNICFFRQPRITFTPYILTDNVSVTSLAANPQLRNESGPHPLMAIVLRVEDAQAEDLRVGFSLDSLHKEIHLGSMLPGKQREVMWYLEHEPSLLNIEKATARNLTITVTYNDLQGNNHKNSWQHEVTLLGRNTLDRFGSIVFFVTPKDIPMSGTPKQIWDAIRHDVTLGDTNGTQFPLETIESGRGSPEDIAILLASAYLSAGLRTSLVESDHGLFVRVWNGRNFIILDPSRIDGAFEGAQSSKPGYAVHDLQTYWKERNATRLSIS